MKSLLSKLNRFVTLILVLCLTLPVPLSAEENSESSFKEDPETNNVPVYLVQNVTADKTRDAVSTFKPDDSGIYEQYQNQVVSNDNQEAERKLAEKRKMVDSMIGRRRQKTAFLGLGTAAALLAAYEANVILRAVKAIGLSVEQSTFINQFLKDIAQRKATVEDLQKKLATRTEEFAKVNEEITAVDGQMDALKKAERADLDLIAERSVSQETAEAEAIAAARARVVDSRARQAEVMARGKELLESSASLKEEMSQLAAKLESQAIPLRVRAHAALREWSRSAAGRTVRFVNRPISLTGLKAIALGAAGYQIYLIGQTVCEIRFIEGKKQTLVKEMQDAGALPAEIRQNVAGE